MAPPWMIFDSSLTRSFATSTALIRPDANSA